MANDQKHISVSLNKDKSGWPDIYAVILSAVNRQTDIFFVFDYHSKEIIFHNKRLREVTGIDEKEIQSSSFPGRFIAVDDYNRVNDHVNQVRKSGSGIIDLTITGKDSSVFTYEFAFTCINSNKSMYIVASGRNITDYLKDREDLKLQNEKYLKLFKKYKTQNENLNQAKEMAEINEENLLTIIENSPLPMVIATGGVHVVFVNKKFTQLYGYRQKDIPTGDHWFSKAYPDKEYRVKVESRWRQAVTEAQIHKKDVVPQEYIMTTKNGEKRIVEFHAVILGEKVVIVASDITDIRNKQEELIRAKEKAEESDRLKSAFLANMSHEIRTPMNGILGFSELLKSKGLDIDNRDLYIDMIEKSGQRMLNTINDLIDIAKIESGQTEVNLSSVNVSELTNQLYELFKPEAVQKGIHISLHEAPDKELQTIYTDKDKLYTILSNLIRNAIKFTNKGSIDIGYDKKGKEVKFYINDSGIGIPEEMQHKIFERFVQSDHYLSNPYEGAGLGLPIAKAFVELLGGRIMLDSKSGEGSKFWFTLPFIIKDEEIREIQNIYMLKSKIINGILKNLSVLVVDDEEISRTYMMELLANKCRELEGVHNGKAAIDFAQKNKDIDLILMDIKMPEMDGYTTTKKIRQRNKKVVIIAQTAYAFAGDREKAILSGCNDYLAKPIRSDDLYNVIIKYFGTMNI